MNNDFLQQFAPAKVLVLGDFMLDHYIFGHVKRISPEAPVPVLQMQEETHRPGGAGNVVLNLLSLGMQVVAVGRIGLDKHGERFLKALEEEHVDLRGVIQEEDYLTTVKTRLIAEYQQLLRVDYERNAPLSPSSEEKIKALLPELLEGVAVVALSDYGKGFLTKTLLTFVIEECRGRNIPVVVDPKGIHFSKYKGATLIKPNLSEAIAASGLGPEADLESIAQKILAETQVKILMITRSKEGITLFDQELIRRDFAANIHEVRDVTGAGDTVLAVITGAVANRLDISLATKWANVAAGLAIEKLGCARITKEELAKRINKTSSVLV